MIIVYLVLGFILTFFFYHIIFKNSGIKFHPLFIFIAIWILVIISTIYFIQFEVEFSNILFFSMLIIASVITILLCSFKKINDINLCQYYFKHYININYNILKITFFICVFFRFGQLFYDLFVLKKLGASLFSVFTDAQWLRQAYLNYSSYGMSFISKILSNILNYFSEFGVILSMVLLFSNRKYSYVIYSVVLSLFNSIFTLSKMAFFIDICYLVSTYLVVYVLFDNSNQSTIETKKTKRKVKQLIVFGFIGIVTLLLLTSIQRGYGGELNFEGKILITLSKAIAYFITPTMAFFKVLSMTNIQYSYGTKTFNTFLKIFGFGFDNFGAIDVGTEDSTVYTMSGMFFADFGLLGCVFFTVIFIFLVNRIFFSTINSFSITKLSFFVMLNTILMMSFFTWMGRITFFWFFPIFVAFFEKFFLKGDK